MLMDLHVLQLDAERMHLQDICGRGIVSHSIW